MKCANCGAPGKPPSDELRDRVTFLAQVELCGPCDWCDAVTWRGGKVYEAGRGARPMSTGIPSSGSKVSR